jgi:hypothetical protein
MTAWRTAETSPSYDSLDWVSISAIISRNFRIAARDWALSTRIRSL